MAVAPYIVKESWIKDSAKAGRLLGKWNTQIPSLCLFCSDETPYMIDDPSGEDKWNFRLSEALARSKKHRGAFLKGHTFFVTKNAGIDKMLLKNIVAAHGGEVSWGHWGQGCLLMQG